MGEGSPLFSSSMELLAHAIEHYVAGSERDRRFMVLHLANAAELLLKDICLDLGESVFEDKRSVTKGIWEITRDLEKHDVKIPQRPIFELLIEERNNIQHRFGSESEVTANWYMEKMLDFFSAVLETRFALKLQEYLADFTDKDTLNRVFPDLAEKDAFASIKQAAKLQPAGAVLTAWIEVEKQLEQLAQRLRPGNDEDEAMYSRVPPSMTVRRATRQLGETEDRELVNDLREMQSLRARVLHGRTSLDEQQAGVAIDKMAKLLDQLKNLTTKAAPPEAAQSSSEGSTEVKKARQPKKRQ